MSSAQNYQAISRRPPDIEDYIDMIRRYRSWIIAPMFAGLVIAVVAAFLYPDTFISYAVLRITPPQVPEQLVPVVSYTQMAERLMAMQTEILSRTTLQDIIQTPSLDLYKKERTHIPMEDIIQEMRNKAIHLTPLASNDRRLATAFQISFSYYDKYKAQLVVRELVKRFVEQNINVQKQAASLTSIFVNDEVRIARDRMAEIDDKITKYRMEHTGKLPEQVQSNTQEMFQLQMQSLQLKDTINRDSQEKVMLESDLQNLRNEQNYYQNNLETTIPGGQSVAVKNEKAIELNKQILSGKANLAALMNTYGPNYPEISTMRAQIADLEKQKAELDEAEMATPAPTATGPRRAVNPAVEKQLQDLRNNINSTQSKIQAKQVEIEEATRGRAALEKQIAVYQKRIDETPANEQQLAALLSDFNLAKTAYEDKLKKLQDSQTAVNLENHKAGEVLEQLDPPTLPDKPVEPNRWAWAGIGTIAGLTIGLSLAAAREIKNTSLKNLKDVRAYTNLPVLSSIPLLENALLLRRKRRLVWLAWSSAVVIGCVLMAGSMYYYMSGSI